MSYILKSLKKYNDETFTLLEHPIGDLDLEYKVTYLYGLGLIMGSDEQADKSEKRFICTLLRTLELPEEVLEGVEENSQSIDEGFIEGLKDILTSNNLVSTFFYDAVMICHQGGNCDKQKKEVIKQMSYLLNFPGENLEIVEKVIKAINSRDKSNIQAIEGEEYWDWKHLLEYTRIKYEPESVKVSSYEKFRILLGRDVFNVNIKLGEGEFWLSEEDVDKLFGATINGAGANKTKIWLIGEENPSFDEGDPFNAHSHEMTVSKLSLESISNCNVVSVHSKILVLTLFFKRNLFNNCKLEGVSEVDSVQRGAEQLDASMDALKEIRDLI
ncbi:hypothetical protein BGL48_01690 [Salinivibrio sp. SS3]|uniref:hypothetical protein n=1 Tax=Salinivibrio sp. SS3 TaxID=1895021 RepID=UPI0008481603|nr:hypothetical protein [Salinivibrio sp. BNH]ODP97153.1 hypothetical protein BGL48_01690 [Salinivibrio sp. BNH]